MAQEIWLRDSVYIIVALLKIKVSWIPKIVSGLLEKLITERIASYREIFFSTGVEEQNWY